jgi:hypothetical protein
MSAAPRKNQSNPLVTVLNSQLKREPAVSGRARVKTTNRKTVRPEITKTGL